MIFKEALSPERQASSQHNYCMFNVINGLSYMCLGETVLILLAVQLGCPDYSARCSTSASCCCRSVKS